MTFSSSGVGIMSLLSAWKVEHGDNKAAYFKRRLRFMGYVSSRLPRGLGKPSRHGIVFFLQNSWVHVNGRSWYVERSQCIV